MNNENNKEEIKKELKPENESRTSPLESEVLVEKVREIERAKGMAKGGSAANLDKNDTSKILGEKRILSEPLTDAEAKRMMSGKSRRSFLVGGAAALIGVFGWRWMPDETKQSLLRRTFEFNEKVSQIFYSPKSLAREFDRRQVGELRVNGGEGLSDGFDPQTWRLQIVGAWNERRHTQFVENIAYETAMDNESEMRETGKQHEQVDAKQKPGAGEMPPETTDRAAASQTRTPGLLLTLEDIKSLPRVEMTTELKCIEGWSVVVNWTGARFSDFLANFLPNTESGNPPDSTRPQDFLPFISLVTPDGGYYVGLDMPSALHPQTLLVYEMNGEPLTLSHGAPLRLVTPTKYGIKQIKRIGRITFTNERPADYWAERGYDWYAGH